MTSRSTRPDAGFGWIGIIVLALMVILAIGAYFIQSQTSAGDTLGRASTKARLNADGSLIVQRISGCALQYPTNAGSGPFPSYPDEPTSALAEDLVCPGSGANLWSGSDGVYFPPDLRGFGDWTYHHDTDGIWIEITGSPADQVLLDEVVSEFGAAAAQPTPGTLRLFVRGT